MRSIRSRSSPNSSSAPSRLSRVASEPHPASAERSRRHSPNEPDAPLRRIRPGSTQELDMSRIDALATLLGVPATARAQAQRHGTHLRRRLYQRPASERGSSERRRSGASSERAAGADDAALVRRLACRTLQPRGRASRPAFDAPTPQRRRAVRCADRARAAEGTAAVGIANGQYRIADRAIRDATDGVRLRNSHLLHGGLRRGGVGESAVRAADDEHVRRRRCARQRPELLGSDSRPTRAPPRRRALRGARLRRPQL